MTTPDYAKIFDGVKVEIRFRHNEVGMSVEARLSGPDVNPVEHEWRTVEMRRHGLHKTRAYGWGQVSTVMDTARDEQAYLAMLDARKIQYTVVS